ncbi:MAG: sigma-54 dependent transcriptional regulator [Deltaproteobacteria bacterium]|jgi:DNA-binding NtrC family response regulator|nr:sigma-54 dependent transcriptional regulator [Deltaproteobacteria bacterium]
MSDFFHKNFILFCEHVAAGRHAEARAMLKAVRRGTAGHGGEPSLKALSGLLDSVEEREAELADLVAELAALRRLQEKRENLLRRENTDLRAGLRKGLQQAVALTANPAMRAVFRQAERIAAAPVPVLITGETGTGKGLLARHIHYSGPRAGGTLISLNCAAIPASLLESELFGIEKGVASGVSARMGHFESASGGTLFLDEIGDMPLESQAKILKALENDSITRIGGRKAMPVDARLISATHRNLEEACAQGRFRQDLFYRLQVIRLHIPPLRERREDIAALAAHFLQTSITRYGLPALVLAPESLRLLEFYAWPGNVRELEHEVERAALLAAGTLIRPEDFSPGLLSVNPAPHTPPPVSAAVKTNGELAGRLKAHPDLLRSITRRIAAYAIDSLPLEAGTTPPARIVPPIATQAGGSLRETELALVRQTLKDCAGNKTHTAKRLGLTREGLRKKLKRLGLT